MSKAWVFGKTLIAMALGTVFGATQMHAETWIVGSQEGVPPFNYFSASGSYDGIDVDILNEAAESIGVTLEHRPMPWRRALLDFEAGKLDAVFQLTPTPERFAKWTMVGPLRSTHTVFATRHDSAIQDITALSDLNGLTLGVVAGYTYGHPLDHDKTLIKEVSGDDFGNVRKLLLGRSDIIVGGRATLVSVIRELNATERVRILPTPLVERDRYIAFSRTADGIDKGLRLQAALNDMRQSTRIAEIINFHLNR